MADNHCRIRCNAAHDYLNAAILPIDACLQVRLLLLANVIQSGGAAGGDRHVESLAERLHLAVAHAV